MTTALSSLRGLQSLQKSQSERFLDDRAGCMHSTGGSHRSSLSRFLAFSSGKVPPGVFWACYGILTPCDQAFWRILRGWKILFMAGQGVCSTFLPMQVTFWVSKCVCHFLGGQTILGSWTRSPIAFLADTLPSDPKLNFFFPQ